MDRINERMNYMKSLPSDLMLNIFSFLEMKDIYYIMLVCKSWKSIAQKLLKNYHSYFFEFSLQNLNAGQFDYLNKNSELTHIKYITKLFKMYQTQKIFDTFSLYFKLSKDYNQSKPDKMFESIYIVCQVNQVRYISHKTLKKMLEHSKNSIKTLCLQSVQMPFHVPSYIPNLRELEQLFLQNNFEIDDSMIQSICSRCKNLKILQLSNCGNLTDKSVECISSISQLQRLDLSCNSGLTLTNIHKLRNNKYLTSLSLKNSSITSQTLDDLLSNVTALRRLNIDECKQLNFLACQVLYTKLPKSIRTLSIDKNNAFTEPQIFDIVDKNEALIKINTTSNCQSNRISAKIKQNRLNIIFKTINQGLLRSYQSGFTNIQDYRQPTIMQFYTSRNYIDLED